MQQRIRLALVVVVGSLCCANVRADVPAADVNIDADAVVAYVNRCRKANGAYGPLDQEYTDAAWNYPAVRTLHLLNIEITTPEAIIEHGCGSPPGHAGYGHAQFFHHHGIRQSLGRSIDPAHRRVVIEHLGFKVGYYTSPFGSTNDLLFKSGGRPNPDPLDIGSRTFYYGNLTSLHDLLAGLKASQREPESTQPLIDSVRRKQAAQGGYCDVRTDNGSPTDADAHVVHTMCATAALDLLNATTSRPGDVAAFIHACRLPDGAYRWNPHSLLPGNEADVYYTWAALRTLKLLNQPHQQVDATRTWLNSLQNADGGFGDRPGWRSRLYSTYYAVEALALLGGDARRNITSKRLAMPPVETIAPGEFHIYQAQFKQPVVTPADLDGLRARGFNLLALKSDKFSDAEPLLAAIRERNLPMDVILCPEAYPHRLLQLGGVNLNHVGNFTLDPRWTTEHRAVWQSADAAGQAGLPWSGYRERVLQPLRQLGCLMYPEQDYQQEYAYMAYDDNRTGACGYNAVLAGFNWAPYDFVRVFSWRERYVERLTPIADVDAHGDLAKWSVHLDPTRTLFIARGPTYADFQEATANGRVVCVVTGTPGVASGVTYYGPRPAVDFVRQRINEWRWWKD